MQEPYDHREREDKLEGRELHLGRRGDAVRRDRPHGKLYRWFDNFWYHNKWKTIISVSITLRGSGYGTKCKIEALLL